jgi:hypothetical protein
VAGLLKFPEQPLTPHPSIPVSTNQTVAFSPENRGDEGFPRECLFCHHCRMVSCGAGARAARVFLCCASAASVFFLAGTGAAQTQPWWRSWRQERDRWLHANLEKVCRESERLVTLTEELRKEAQAHKPTRLSASVLERVLELEKRARDLHQAVEGLDENFLSVEVVQGARDIREEAKSLGKLFGESPSKEKLEKLRRLAREVEKRADSVYDHMRRP